MKINEAIDCPMCKEKPELSMPSGNLIGWEHKCKNDDVGFARHTFPDASIEFVLDDWSRYCKLVESYAPGFKSISIPSATVGNNTAKRFNSPPS